MRSGISFVFGECNAVPSIPLTFEDYFADSVYVACWECPTCTLLINVEMYKQTTCNCGQQNLTAELATLLQIIKTC